MLPVRKARPIIAQKHWINLQITFKRISREISTRQLRLNSNLHNQRTTNTWTCPITYQAKISAILSPDTRDKGFPRWSHLSRAQPCRTPMLRWTRKIWLPQRPRQSLSTKTNQKDMSWARALGNQQTGNSNNSQITTFSARSWLLTGCLKTKK